MAWANWTPPSAMEGALKRVCVERQPWMADARCRGLDPDRFYPERGDVQALKSALTVCSACPVRAECLEYALAAGEDDGVWGGTSGRDRRRIRRERIRQRRKGAAA